MRITDCERAHIVVSGARGENARQAAAPGQLVEQARRLAEKAEELLEQAVIAERARNTSWDQIGQALGGSPSPQRTSGMATSIASGALTSTALPPKMRTPARKP